MAQQENALGTRVAELSLISKIYVVERREGAPQSCSMCALTHVHAHEHIYKNKQTNKTTINASYVVHSPLPGESQTL